MDYTESGAHNLLLTEPLDVRDPSHAPARIISVLRPVGEATKLFSIFFQTEGYQGKDVFESCGWTT